MTPNAKRWITLDEQWLSNTKKADKYASGLYYDPIKASIWKAKADTARRKQNELENNLSDEDKDSIESEYQVGDMFERNEE